MTDNETIARFMGYEGQHEEWCGSNILKFDSFTGDDQMVPFQPESDWRDLMPVWYKFRDLHFATPLNLSEYRSYKDHWYGIAAAIPREDIQSVCKRIASAIQWYNANKQL